MGTSIGPVAQGGRFSQAYDALLSLVCPPECAWCALPIACGHSFCGECRSTLVSDYYRCQKCATPIPSVLPNQQCFRCRDQNWKFSRVFTLGPYRGVLREAVIRCKKRRYEPLRYGIGGLLGQVIRDGLVEDDYSADLPQPWLVPVPYHWSHAMDGAANTTASLAAAIGRHASLPVKTGLIARIRKTSKQGMLSWSERKENVRGAFAVRQARILIGRHVLLVDDVLTSGATAAELSSQMLKAGAARVSVVVVARATGTREQSANHKLKGGQSAGVL